MHHKAKPVDSRRQGKCGVRAAEAHMFICGDLRGNAATGPHARRATVALSAQESAKAIVALKPGKSGRSEGPNGRSGMTL